MVGVVRDIEPSVVKDKRQPGVVGDRKKPGVARDKRSLMSIETKRLACCRDFASLCLEPSLMEHLLIQDSVCPLCLQRIFRMTMFSRMTACPADSTHKKRISTLAYA
ncbi:hypothetical protein ARMSODRAFT_958486 [Armillaria solidipes]|uniref:Uncharacterized protein n=1 Tax=Armillaria solidipes TaxID=1076256 RepID=A0A2H3BPE1_9AGAR|nr:hypothetical protein ARMSODRAFT_958486 [Armillaria solidipes]